MILQALNQYYERKVALGDGEIASFGFSPEKIPVVFELDADGQIVQIKTTDRRETIPQIVPQAIKKTSGIASNLLWENAEYALGVHNEKTKKLHDDLVKEIKSLPEPSASDDGIVALINFLKNPLSDIESDLSWSTLWENAEYALGVHYEKTKKLHDDLVKEIKKTKKRHAAFVKKIRSLPEPAASDDGIVALTRFLDNFIFNDIQDDSILDVLKKKPNVSFQLQGDSFLICHRPLVREAIRNVSNSSSKNTGLCLVSGTDQPIMRLHPPIKGVWGAKSTGRNIVTVNNKISKTGDNQGETPSFSSYKKQQGYNSPTGEYSSFAYTTALNHLLRKDSSQRIQVGDASTVFWAEKTTSMESDFSTIFGSTPKKVKDDPDAYTRAVKAVFDSAYQGRHQENKLANRFYVLGLSPNVSRISIRFWQVATVTEISQRIKQHFEYLCMIHHAPHEMPYLPLLSLLKSVAVRGEPKNIPPNLAGELMRSILTGCPYSFALLSAAVRRCKVTPSSEKKKLEDRKYHYPRAAIIKACINSYQSKEELKMALDIENTNPAYRLGRLFAVLEKIQEEANPGINATIRDRYYGAASSNPVSVFPTPLLKLKNHHLSKLESLGRKIYFEELIGEIMWKVLDFPASMNLQDQGRFAVGYYHQRQYLFTKKPKEPGEES